MFNDWQALLNHLQMHLGHIPPEVDERVMHTGSSIIYPDEEIEPVAMTTSAMILASWSLSGRKYQTEAHPNPQLHNGDLRSSASWRRIGRGLTLTIWVLGIKRACHAPGLIGGRAQNIVVLARIELTLAKFKNVQRTGIFDSGLV